MIGSRVKDPADIRTYTINWAAWLTSLEADTLSTSTWILPAALTNVAESNTTTLANVKLSGGATGQVYTVSNKVVTTGGQTRQVSFELVVETQ